MPDLSDLDLNHQEPSAQDDNDDEDYLTFDRHQDPLDFYDAYFNDDNSSQDEDDDDDETISTDPSRLTKRQRGNLGTDFLQLPMEPQIKKHLTEEEHAMRRAEMARRRKNLSEKKNEEEKMDVINKLLRKQAPRKRGRVSTAGTAAAVEDEKGETAEEEQVINKEFSPKVNMIRYVWGKDGCKLGVPQRWIDAGAGGGVIVNQKVEPLS
ncbi:hypothetical protein KEM56_001822 [Ascosphaera pollenicola]|nr:hypothetical protein KEM56_001822 [Ascosphaera pollenicola]